MTFEKKLNELPPGERIAISKIAKKYGWGEEETENKISAVLEVNPSLGYLNSFDGVFIKRESPRETATSDLDLVQLIEDLEREYINWDAIQHIDDTINKAKLAEELVRKTDDLLCILGKIGGITEGISYEEIDVSKLNENELQALKQVFELISTKPKEEITFGDAFTWFRIALVSEKLGWINEAELCYKMTIDYDETDTIAWNNLALLLADQDRIEEAEEACRTALKYDEKFAGAWNNLALLLTGQGRIEEAEEACRTALKYDEKYADAWNNLALLLTGQGRIEEAEEACRTALKYDEKFAGAWNNLALLLADQDRIEEAEEAYRTALKYDETNKKAQNYINYVPYKRKE